MSNKKYFIYTWGCQMNVADSERIAGDYHNKGYVEAKSPEEADEIVLTTCSVRKSAEDRVLGLVHNFSQKAKQSKKRPKLIVTGCMLHYGEEILRKKLPLVDEFLPISEVGFNTPSIRKDKQHAWVPISSGCNSFCTYCIVPKSRGREISRPFDDIVAEVKDLAKKGYKSLTLLGQNVNSWGLEKIGIGMRKQLNDQRQIPAPQTQYLPFEGLPPFVKLLQAVCAVEGVEKVDFITSNPWDFHQELIDFIASEPKISRFIHLPVQSGDNEILKRMNRGYTREQYLELVKRIRKQIPDVEFGTDIIVGFPGETEEQFQNTVSLCKQVKFKIAYVSRYSPRPGTYSARHLEDEVHDLEKKRRWQILDELVNKK